MTQLTDMIEEMLQSDGEGASRLVSEVEQLGLATAKGVIERFSVLIADFHLSAAAAAAASAGNLTGESPGEVPVAEGRVLRADDRATQRTQAATAKAMESYFALLRHLSEVTIAQLTNAAEGPRSDPNSDRLELPAVSPGGRSSGRVWLHNATPSTMTKLRLWTPGLYSHNGRTIPGGVLAFSPPWLDRVEPGEDCEVLVSADVHADISCGVYHGQLLVEKLPDVGLPVVLNVRMNVPRAL